MNAVESIIVEEGLEMTESSVEQVLKVAEGLNDVERYQLALALFKGLRKAIGAPKKRKASVEGDKPKGKSPSQASWHEGLKHIREVVEKVEKDVAYKAIQKVASSLKSREDWPMVEESAILAAFEELKNSSDASSIVSKSSKASTKEPKAPKAKKVKEELSEEEKKARRSAAAKAAAAKRAANKAAKKAEEAVEEKAVVVEEKAVVVEEAVEEEQEPEQYVWKHQDKTYMRLDLDGIPHIFDESGETWLGVFVEKTGKIVKALGKQKYSNPYEDSE